MSQTIPSQHAASDTGLIADLNNTYDMLGLFAQVLAGSVGVVSVTDTTNVSAVQAIATAQSAGKLPVLLLPSGDTSGATDTTKVNNALGAQNAGSTVVLAPGDWYASAPYNVPTGVTLAGVKGEINGESSTNPTSTVIHPATSFSSSLHVTGVVAVQQISTSSPSIGVHLRDFTIINDLGSPSNVDGIALYGQADGMRFGNLAITKVSGYGIRWYQDSSGNDADGAWLDHIMIQRPGKSAFYRIPGDADIHNCHVQYAGQVSGSSDGTGFYVQNGGNIRFTACRSDLCLGSGFTLDHPGVGSGYCDAIILNGCSTERNGQHGCLITNSSSTGGTWRDPVIITGCHFGEDGTGGVPAVGGNFAGVWVEGQNRVFIHGTGVDVGTVDFASGCPKFALGIATIGSGSSGPEMIEWSSGHLNYANVSGAAWCNNPTGVASHLVLGHTVTASQGYQNLGGVVLRNGAATLSGGSATVSNIFATGSSRIALMPTTTSETFAVTSRTSGSFTISSSNGSSSATVHWVLLN